MLDAFLLIFQDAKVLVNALDFMITKPLLTPKTCCWNGMNSTTKNPLPKNQKNTFHNEIKHHLFMSKIWLWVKTPYPGDP